MSVQCVCDKCKKIIYPTKPYNLLFKDGHNDTYISITKPIEKYGPHTSNYDLCDDCLKELEKWLKGEARCINGY